MAILLDCTLQTNNEEKITVTVVEKHDQHDFNNYIIGEDAIMAIKIRDAIEEGRNHFIIDGEKYKITKYKVFDESFCLLRSNLTFDLTNKKMFYDIYLFQSRSKCDTNNHKVLPATAFVRTQSHKSVPINIDHCKDCNKHYINRVSLAIFEKKYGELLACKIDEKNKVMKIDNSEDIYKRRSQESTLAKYGYSVSKQNGLTARQRMRILKNVLEEGNMSKSEIIDHLEYLIRERKDRPFMETAISKWTDDLRFINEYKMDEQEVVFGRLVIKKKADRK